VAADAVLAGMIGLLSLIAGFTLMEGVITPSAQWWWYPLWAVSSAALVVRRRYPVAVTVVTAGALVLQQVGGGETVPWALLVEMYTLAAHRRSRTAWGAAAAVATVVVVLDEFTRFQVESPGTAAVGLVVAVLIGSNVRSRRAYLTGLVERAARLEREKAQEARLAAQTERARIARELHDVVAHGMSVMISLADGADAVAGTDPERSRAAVRQIGQVGRSSLSDMRRLLGVLRDDRPLAGPEPAPAMAPQPALADLDALVETYRAAGLPVGVTVSGTAPESSSVQLVLYRAVQESLTNALRHAVSPSRVLVDLRYDANVSTLRVIDDGAAAHSTGTPEALGSQRGLLGLQERATLFGGNADAHPRPDGGWQVTVTIPSDHAP